MIALKIPKPPPTNVHDLALLQTRLLAGKAPVGTSRELLAVLPVAIYTTDAEGRITFCNEAAATLWGRHPLFGTDLYCGSWRNLAADGTPLPHDRLAVATALITGKDVADAERIVIRPDGSQVRVAPFPTLLRDAIGTVTGAIVLLLDVTASRAAAAELRESEEHCRSANALNPQMPWTADPQGKVLEFGERWCSFIGQSHAEALRSNWHDVVNPGDIGRMRAAMAKSLASGEPYDVRYRVRTASGAERWVRSRAEPRRDADGAIIRWYGSTEDIHDSVLIKEEARVASNRHNLISQAADDVGWDMDLVNDVVSWTATLERRFGIWPEGGKSSRGWWLEQIHPDDRARVVSTIAASLAGPSNHHSAEYRFRRGDGCYAHVLDRATLIRDRGGGSSGRSAPCSTAPSTRARRRPCGSARSDSAPPKPPPAWPPMPPSISPGISTSCTTPSPGARRSSAASGCGRTRRKATGPGGETISTPTIVRASSDLLATTMAGAATRLRAEYRFRRADGSYAHVLDRGSLIRNDEGRVVRAIGAMIDLTERRRQEEALRLSEERFRLAATAAGLGVADIDTVTGAEHWSAEFRAILGVPDECDGQPGHLYSADPSRRPGRRGRAPSPRSGRRVRRGPQERCYRIVRANDGAIRWLETERHAHAQRRGRHCPHHHHQQGHYRGKDRAGPGQLGRHS